MLAGFVAVWPTVSAWVPMPEMLAERLTRRINPGLDIQGGLRLMYEVEVDEAVRDRRDVRAEQVIERLGVKMGILEEDEAASREDLAKVRKRARTKAVGERSFRLTTHKAGDLKKLDRESIRSFGDLRETDRTDRSLTLELTDDSIERLREVSVEQARETVGNRIDELGLREAAVMARDTDIIVELPGAGGDDCPQGYYCGADDTCQPKAAHRASEAKASAEGTPCTDQFDEIRDIISRTARLEFKIVDDEATFVRDLTDLPEGIELSSELVSAGEQKPQVSSAYLLAKGEEGRSRLSNYIDTLSNEGRLPDDHQLAIGRMDQLEQDQGSGDEQESWRTYYLFDRAEVSGDYIEDASVAIDPQDNKPYVALNFDSEGARVFERLTGANIKRRMAIVLDDRVNTAPVIQARIGGGRAQITLGGYRDYNELLNEANELVIVLRAGALPAPIRPANEQLIGPTLGKDSVRRGAQGALIGIGLVLLFMLLYYHVAGGVADVMVLLNVGLLLAILAAFNATLTLPGIAGIALTVGMAVDANVLITERIREELHTGKSARASVDQGFRRAFWSIFDSQITTFIAGVVLFQYGTGPIKGFAVTLMIGIITSLFTGVFCSKVMFDWIVRGLRVKTLRVG